MAADERGAHEPCARPLRQLTALEARALGVLIEKERTVPDTYPLTLNALVAGCNQKTSRSPVIDAGEAEMVAALEALKGLSLVIESSGGRVMRYSQNVKRVLQVPSESVALLATLMLRGPQTAAELRANSERLCRFSDVYAVEAFLHELAGPTGGSLVVELARQPGSRENRWTHLLCGDGKLTATAADERVADDPGVQVDLPEVLAEVTALFARHEKTLLDEDPAMLGALLWQSPKALLHGAAESFHGIDGLRRSSVGRRATDTAPRILFMQVCTFGRDYATTSVELIREGSPQVERQSHAWVRLPEGWRIVAAHVSRVSQASGT